jgi:hypothetical protein
VTVKKTLLSMLALAILLGTVGLTRAEDEMKPVAVVSFSGIDKMMRNIGALARLGGKPELEQQLTMLMQMAAQNAGGGGLDAKMPWGAAVLTDGQRVVQYAFLPVANLKEVMAALQANPMLADKLKIELDNDTYAITVQMTRAFARQQGSWTVFASASDDLAHAPADPLKLFGDLPTNYDLACNVSLKDLPESLRGQMLVGFQSGAQAGMKQLPNETDEAYQLRVTAVQGAVEQVTALIEDLDHLTLGWRLDSTIAKEKTYLDLELVAKAGTKLANRLGEVKARKTRFAGFALPEAAIAAQWAGVIGDADVAWFKSNLPMLRETIVHQLEKGHRSDVRRKLMERLLDVWQKTIEAKVNEGGFAAVLDPAAATLVAGVGVTGGEELEAIVKQLVEEVQQSAPSQVKSAKFNADTHQGVHLHTISCASAPKTASVFGDVLELVIGTADDKVVFAGGRDALKTLQKALDQSQVDADKEVPPVRITVSPGKIAKFVAAVAEDENVKERAANMSEALAKAGPNDRVVLTAGPIPQGVRVRLELEDGLLKALAEMGIKALPMPNLGGPGGP